jgi:hypothetical protein
LTAEGDRFGGQVDNSTLAGTLAASLVALASRVELASP